MISIQLPDGSAREFPARSRSPKSPRPSAPGLAKAALAGRIGEGDGKVVDTASRIDHDSAARDRHRQGPGRPGRDPPLDGAPAGLCGEGAVPRCAGDDRPGDRERLLLRLLVQAPVHARGPGGDREAKMAELAKKDEPVDAPRAAARRGRRVFQGASARHYKAEIIGSIPAGEDVSLYREGAFEDLCRGPHVPSHRQAQALQADEGGRRLLARRPPQRDAPAHLRHGLGDQGRAAAVPARCSRRPRSATTASSAASSTCSTSTRSRPGVVFWHPEGLGALAGRSSSTCAQVYRDTGYQEVKGPQILDKSLWEKTGPLAELPREHVHDRVGEARLRAQADELPGPRADLQVGTCAATATCRCATASSASATATSRRGALHGIMRVRGFTQDDGHVFCTEDQILDECVAYTAQLQKVYERLRLHRHHLQGRDAAGEPRRLRRALGQGRARAAWKRCAARACEFVIAPGRRRVLRPEDRVHAEGRARPPVAVRHDAGRLQHGRAAGRRVRDRDERPRASR